ncbi:homeodomain-only protein [Folsomia candida]|uniref:Homeodomain-only protein n=1 Tax=Folsomia candida TaxID=158441 RepID=A0A226DJR1_FOLCA|nr:homeodomain-only protein [Folsomia candida]XP_021961129.1 homeodomain-only protein [Folsomia candida]XP_021961130.1 homeodomain-only protein [Folsomia candida]OXA45765.1 Homeodomain-only protein [Folsomia candida]
MATGAMRVVPELQQQQKQQQQRREEQEGRGGKMNLDLRLTEEQEEYLELQFKKSKNPHPSELMLTAAETGLLEEEVQAWFKQRMAMWRRDQGLNPVSSRIC